MKTKTQWYAMYQHTSQGYGASASVDLYLFLCVMGVTEMMMLGMKGGEYTGGGWMAQRERKKEKSNCSIC